LPGGKSLGVNPHRKTGRRVNGSALTIESLQAAVSNAAELIRLTRDAVDQIRQLKGRGR
jgi:hypothetical protein